MSMTFEQFFSGFGFKYFSAVELLCKGESNAASSTVAFGLNTDPPPDLWWSIIPTVRVLEWLREDVGAPIRISSAYRSPAYNKAIGGASESQHMRFTATDISSPGLAPEFLYDRLKWARSNGMFKGGLGLYPTFVHIDTRGFNADW